MAERSRADLEKRRAELYKEQADITDELQEIHDELEARDLAERTQARLAELTPSERDALVRAAAAAGNGGGR